MPGSPPGTLQHIMLEVEDLDSVGRAYDRCVDAGVTMLTTIGKHTNDHVVSFYCSSPSGLTIEYGCFGRKIDDSTHVTGFYDTASFWGHRPPSGATHQV
jgi:3,4-dihydroxy-9,10-secoandrosta-1,3,5(10)-triene-9,17-dione 4,5-dioxygenase